MKTIFSFLLLFFLGSMTIFSQKKPQNHFTNSIYFLENEPDTLRLFTLNSRLKIPIFKYRLSGFNNYQSSYFTVSNKENSKKFNSFLFLDPQNYINKNFLRKIDPTKWPASYFIYKPM